MAVRQVDMSRHRRSLLLCLIVCHMNSAVAGDSDTSDMKLIKLAVIFRHGDRSPVHDFPTNPYPPHDQRYWPEGKGQLTANGKKRMDDLGGFIRKRYAHFLPDNHMYVNARSSPTERCIDSVSHVLAAAFPSGGLGHLPIPVNSVKHGPDRMLGNTDHFPCVARDRAEELQSAADDVKAFQLKVQEHMKAISNHSGTEKADMVSIHMVYDTLFSIMNQQYELPQWATEERMHFMSSINDKTFCIESSTHQLQRLSTGLFWHDLKSKFTSRIAYQNSFFYATHDTRIPSLLRIVNGYDGSHPGFGATMIFELLQHAKTNERVIRVFSLKDTFSHSPQRLIPLGCQEGSECSADKFFEGVKVFIADEATIVKECEILPTKSQTTGCFE